MDTNVVTAERVAAASFEPAICPPPPPLMAWVGPIPDFVVAGVVAMPAGEVGCELLVTEPQKPRLMRLSDVVEYRAEDGYVMARIGTGDCPWGCGNHGAAEAGRRGWCPNPFCAGPVLAVLGPKGER